MSKAELTIEGWTEVWPAILELFSLHREEIGRKDIFDPLDIDSELVIQMEAANGLRIITARSDGDLVGYCIWYLSPNIETKGQLLATQGPWYVLPEWRTQGLGLELMRYALSVVKDAGAKLALLHHWVNPADPSRPDISKLFAFLGAIEVERVYALKLVTMPQS